MNCYYLIDLNPTSEADACAQVDACAAAARGTRNLCKKSPKGRLLVHVKLTDRGKRDELRECIAQIGTIDDEWYD